MVIDSFPILLFIYLFFFLEFCDPFETKIGGNVIYSYLTTWKQFEIMYKIISFLFFIISIFQIHSVMKKRY